MYGVRCRILRVLKNFYEGIVINEELRRRVTEEERVDRAPRTV